jgi:PAS domain S-box-containing protein
MFILIAIAFSLLYLATLDNLSKSYKDSEEHQQVLMIMRELSVLNEHIAETNSIEQEALLPDIDKSASLQKWAILKDSVKQVSERIHRFNSNKIILETKADLDEHVQSFLLSTEKLLYSRLYQNVSLADSRKIIRNNIQINQDLHQHITEMENRGRLILNQDIQAKEKLIEITSRQFDLIGIVSASLLVMLLLYLFRNLRRLDENIARSRYLANIAQKSNDAIFGSDATFKIDFWNKTAEKWYGPAELEMIGTNMLDLMDRFSVDTEGLKEYLLKESHTRDSITFQTTDIRKDGSLFHTLNTVSKLFDNKGNITNYICACRDITDLVKLQRDLEEANEKLMTELLLKKKELLEFNERITDGIVSLDKDFCITYANNYARRLMGGDDIIGKKAWHLLPDPGMNQKMEELIRKIFEHKQNFTFDYYLNVYDKWMQANAYPSENGISFIFRDITQQKQAEFSLKESEEKYRNLVESSPDIIVVCDDNGTIWDCSGAVKERAGYSSREIIGKNLNDFMLEDDLRYFPLQYHEIPAKGFLFTQRRGKRKDGTIVHFEVRVSHIGENKLLAILTDISDREMLQKNLTENNARLDFLFMNTPSYIVSLDAEGVILDLNKNIDVFQRDTILGKKLLSILPDYLQEDTRLTLEEVKRTRETVYRQFSFTSSSGHKFWFSTILKPIIKDDTVVGILTNTSDITVIKEQEKELLKTKERLQKIMESIPAFIAELDENGNIISINKSRTGKEPETLIGLPLAECVEFADNGKINQSITACLQTNEPIELELNLLLSDSIHPVVYLCNFLPLSNKQKNQTVLLTAFDISESRRKEAEARRLDEIIKASPAWAAIADVSGKIVFMNNAMRSALEIPAEEDISHLTISDTHEATGLKKIFDKVSSIKGNQIAQFESDFKSRSGKIIPVLQVVMKHYDEKGETAFYSMKGIDLTELNKKTEEVKRLADIIDNTEAIVGIGDLDGSIVFLNNSGRRILGFGQTEDLTSMNIKNLHSEEMKERLEAIAIKEAMKYGSWMGESIIVSRTGERIPIKQVIVLHKNKNGEPIYLSTTAIDIREEKEYASKLAEVNEDLRNLAAHLQEIREEERVEIAKEIHDELGQKLAVLKMESAFIEKNLIKQYAIKPDIFSSINSIIDETIQTSRELYNNLRPTMLNELGLVATITWMKSALEKRTDSNIHLHLSIPEDRQYAEYINIGLFRIIQESLNNIAKHAGAKNIHIDLSEADKIVRLAIEDDGKGFIPDLVDTKMHHGVLGMRERSLAMGGSFLLDTAPDKGTRIEVVVPLNQTT